MHTAELTWKDHTFLSQKSNLKYYTLASSPILNILSVQVPGPMQSLEEVEKQALNNDYVMTYYKVYKENTHTYFRRLLTA